jgi:hypothetical protein
MRGPHGYIGDLAGVDGEAAPALDVAAAIDLTDEQEGGRDE